SDLLSYGSYEFESAIRASVIIGAVGGGGLGSELVGSLAALDYHRVTTQILALVTVIAIFDKLTVWLRRRPQIIWGLLVIGVICIGRFGPRSAVSLSNLRTLGSMFPPELSGPDWHNLPTLVMETFGMALAGTLLAIVIAVCLGAASSRSLAPA